MMICTDKNRKPEGIKDTAVLRYLYEKLMGEYFPERKIDYNRMSNESATPFDIAETNFKLNLMKQLDLPRGTDRRPLIDICLSALVKMEKEVTKH